MATKLETALIIKHQIFLSPDPADENGADGSPIPISSEQTDRWKQGQGLAQNDREYQRKRTLAPSGVDAYNTLGAGGLNDRLNQGLDLDEIKTFSIKCTGGEIDVIGGTGTPLPIFTTAASGIHLEAGHMAAFSLGPAGLNVEVNSLFDIVESSGSNPASYVLTITGAN